MDEALGFAPDAAIRCREFRIGCIGAGFIMADVHLAAYADADLRELGRYDGLRMALQALCALDEAALQQINETLEQAFPRRDRR